MKQHPTPPTRLAVIAGIGGIIGALALPGDAQASIFSGETLDSVANGIAWVVLVLVPIVGLAAFWMVHILPEKIAEKRHHPQAEAIQVLCLLSLVFGGLLWPLAWLWAYSKPVLYRMAYGTDQVEHGGGGHSQPAQPPKLPDEDTKVTTVEADDVSSLRARIAELEARLAGTAATAGRAGEGAKA